MTDRMSKEELQARVNAMSKDEAQDALTFLIGWTPEGMQEAIEFGDRVAANRARIRAERQPSPCPGGPSLPAEAQPRGEHPYPDAPACPSVSGENTQCTAGHASHMPPHRDLLGNEWTDAGETEGDRL